MHYMTIKMMLNLITNESNDFDAIPYTITDSLKCEELLAFGWILNVHFVNFSRFTTCIMRR